MIIGFGHKAQTGKDTAGQYLVESQGFVRASFGDHLKTVCSLVTGIPIEKFYDHKKEFNEDWGMTHREILQRLGTDAMRNHFHEDTWVLGCLNQLMQRKSYIITDVRFPNEADAIKERGGYVIRVDRDTTGYDIDRNHPSETGLDDYTDWDYIIKNDGSLEDFHYKIDCILDKIYKDAYGGINGFN